VQQVKGFADDCRIRWIQRRSRPETRGEVGRDAGRDRVAGAFREFADLGRRRNERGLIVDVESQEAG
jgi:hypothetical protein